MPRTDGRGRHGDEEHYYIPGATGVNLPTIPFHGPKEEQLRLLQAVRTHIGPCDCIVHHDPFGNHCEGHPCAGHQFLCESDEAGRTLEWTVPQPFGATHFTSGSLSNCVTRLDRLMFARHMKWRWVKQEMAGVPQPYWPPKDGWQHEKRRDPMEPGPEVIPW